MYPYTQHITFSSTHVRSLSARHEYKRRLQKKGLFRHPFFPPISQALCALLLALAPYPLVHRALTHLLYPNKTMATSRMFLPLMFPDRTGSIYGSEFSELYDRMYLCVHRIRRDSDGGGATQYGIFNTAVTPFNAPVATLEFVGVGTGDETIGTVTFSGPGGSTRTHTMSSFLTIVGG